MLRILVLDRSNPVFMKWTEGFAHAVSDLDAKVILASDKERSRVSGNLEVVNIFDVPQSHDIATLERKLKFSLHKILVPERAFFDYSSFRRCQTYSNLGLEEVGRRVTPYLNAFDYLIRERVDIVLEGLMDNFMTSAAGHMAAFYGKPFFMGYVYYWWADGIFFVDRLDQTSEEIDRRYRQYRMHPEQIDRQRVEGVFAKKRVAMTFPGGGVYPLKLRLQQLIGRRNSYEPISWKHWICRRISAIVSRLLIYAFIERHTVPLDEDFVLFPLHVSPEATLLGNEPELADQLSLIKNISMNLPFGVKLYVKEHPAQFLGHGLDYGFYRRITSLPNVRYFRGEASLRDLLAHPRCLAAAVINGTVGLETAMQRKPVFVFGRAIYGAGDCFLKPRNFQEFFRQLQEIRHGGYRFDEQALYAILQALDDAVVKADIDIARYRSWSELVLSSYPIYREFVLRQLARNAATATGNS